MERFAFDKIWFSEHQKGLLFLLNAPVIKCWFRWVMRIRKNDCSLKDTICEIQPNNYNVYLGMFLGKNGLYYKYRRDFRTHNKYSKRLYCAFYPLWLVMHIWDSIYADRHAPQLSFGFSTLTVYPDAGHASTTTDGWVARDGVDEAWATIIAGAGNDGTPSDDATYFAFKALKAVTNFGAVIRSIYTFDTSSLTAGATISAATFSINGNTKQDDAVNTPSLNVYGATPASNSSLANADYSQIGSTAFATAIAYSSIATAGAYNDLALNASGIANISKTGISKFGIRNANYDVAASAPTGMANSNEFNFKVYFADQAGTTQDPKLVVTYSASVAYTLTASVGTYTLTGIASAFQVAYHMTAAKGAYVLTGIANIMQYGRVLTASLGTYTLTGISAAFQKSLHMTASVGTYTLTGIATAFNKALHMTASMGSYTLSGLAVILRTTAWGSPLKNAANWLNPNKNSAPNWTNPNKNNSNWTFPNKN